LLSRSKTGTFPRVSAGENQPQTYENYDLIPSLMDVLRVAIEDARDGRTVKQTYTDLGRLINRDERTVRGYLDRTRKPITELVEPFVAAVAAETGSSRARYWQEAAVRMAEVIVDDYRGKDPRVEAMMAAIAARRPGPRSVGD
jgi:YD repeat-containing protein